MNEETAIALMSVHNVVSSISHHNTIGNVGIFI